MIKKSKIYKAVFLIGYFKSKSIFHKEQALVACSDLNIDIHSTFALEYYDLYQRAKILACRLIWADLA